MKGQLDGREELLREMVENYPDATLKEYCEYWGITYNQWVSITTMCRALQKQELSRKKRHYAAAKEKQNESSI
ncbi:IS630 transposase-related protein, partial [Umezakia ovalisporum]